MLAFILVIVCLIAKITFPWWALILLVIGVLVDYADWSTFKDDFRYFFKLELSTERKEPVTAKPLPNNEDVH